MDKALSLVLFIDAQLRDWATGAIAVNSIGNTLFGCQSLDSATFIQTDHQAEGVSLVDLHLPQIADVGPDPPQVPKRIPLDHDDYFAQVLSGSQVWGQKEIRSATDSCAI